MNKAVVTEPELNQTQFVEESIFIEKQEASELPEPVNKNKLYVLGALGILAALMILSLGLMILLRPKKIAPEDITVQIDSEAREIGPLERQLMILERDIENADPLESALSFPPVNFELKLQDATQLQQK